MDETVTSSAGFADPASPPSLRSGSILNSCLQLMRLFRQQLQILERVATTICNRLHMINMNCRRQLACNLLHLSPDVFAARCHDSDIIPLA